ncbi:MAG: hypothetical protein FOGNACKC_00779 [Anaerolineae bacterium]|nr:hypothetical protein [Anaerolineae bacterium]
MEKYKLSDVEVIEAVPVVRMVTVPVIPSGAPVELSYEMVQVTARLRFEGTLAAVVVRRDLPIQAWTQRDENDMTPLFAEVDHIEVPETSALEKFAAFLDEYGLRCEFERDWPHDPIWYLDVHRPRNGSPHTHITLSDGDFGQAIQRAMSEVERAGWKVKGVKRESGR